MRRKNDSNLGINPGCGLPSNKKSKAGLPEMLPWAKLILVCAYRSDKFKLMLAFAGICGAPFFLPQYFTKAIFDGHFQVEVKSDKAAKILVKSRKFE